MGENPKYGVPFVNKMRYKGLESNEGIIQVVNQPIYCPLRQIMSTPYERNEVKMAPLPLGPPPKRVFNGPRPPPGAIQYKWVPADPHPVLVPVNIDLPQYFYAQLPHTGQSDWMFAGFRVEYNMLVYI